MTNIIQLTSPEGWFALDPLPQSQLRDMLSDLADFVTARVA